MKIKKIYVCAGEGRRVFSFSSVQFLLSVGASIFWGEVVTHIGFYTFANGPSKVRATSLVSIPDPLHLDQVSSYRR